MPRSRAQRESDKAEAEDHPVEKEHVHHDWHDVTHDKDHRDHLGVDHREGPKDPLEPTDHLTGYDEPEAPVDPPEPEDEPDDLNFLRNEVQVPVNPEDHET